MNDPLRLGTRASALAKAQAGAVADAVTARTGRAVELVEIRTEGDASSAPLDQIGGTGVFVGALREALAAGTIDFAVHSLKDLPTAPAAGLVIAAIPVREDPRDALVARGGLTLGELRPGAKVGTGSPRRAAQLHALGFDIEVVPIRGNVDTRLGLVARGELDAVVLARAGLARLGRLEEITEVVDPIQMLPAPGQGALAIECRDPAVDPDAADLVKLLAELDDPDTRYVVEAERALLATLEAGCTAPVGALGEAIAGDEEYEAEIYLRAIALTPNGEHAVKLSTSGRLVDAVALARRLAEEMLAEGAAELMNEVPEAGP
ncbi:MAG: hydroxymethylbilane synthase [Sporichthyaceae bacterium]